MTEILSVQHLFSVSFIIGFSVELTVGKDGDPVCTAHGACHTARPLTNVCGTKDGRKEQPDDSPRSPSAGSTVGPGCPLRQGSYLRASYPEGNQVYLSVLANFPRESSSSLPYDGE